MATRFTLKWIQLIQLFSRSQASWCRTVRLRRSPPSSRPPPPSPPPRSQSDTSGEALGTHLQGGNNFKVILNLSPFANSPNRPTLINTNQSSVLKGRVLRFFPTIYYAQGVQWKNKICLRYPPFKTPISFIASQHRTTRSPKNFLEAN